MSKIRIVGLRAERNVIMNVLERSGSFEIAPTGELGAGERVRETSHLDKVTVRRSRLGFAIDFLNRVCAEAGRPNKKPAGRAVMGYDDFYDVAAKEYELLAAVDELEKISFERVEIKSQISKLQNLNRRLAPYKSVEARFSDFRSTDSAAAILALGPSAAPNPLSDADFPSHAENYGCAEGTLIGVIVQKADRESALERLSAAGFAPCPFDGDSVPAEAIARNDAEIARLENRDAELLQAALDYNRYIDEFMTLFDVLGLEVEKSEAELDFVRTNSAFVLEGWAPEETAGRILDEVRSKTDNVVTAVCQIDKDDKPPTLNTNVKIVKPFEGITNMYSAPAYGEIDPNPFMSVFFFVFFGIILGDAGYGLVLSVLCFLALKFIKLEKSVRGMIQVFGICGVSAVVAGAVFGGYFGIAGAPALWFNPMDNPILMLAVSLVLGVIHLSVGYGINMVKKIKNGHIADGILSVIFIYMIFIGVGFFALNLIIPSAKWLTTAALYTLAAAMAGILLTNGRASKKLGGKIIGGLSGLYGLINLFSDVLSYARLFGLALSSGAVGLAFNMLAAMFFTGPVGYIIGAILLVVLHSLNMALSLLSAFVHNIRLQYLEFYGKFYEGGGRPFTPMGGKTKYVRFQ
jgi:V/A-type H+-transporting ATPase subunit I